jgi:hypothetical protein
VGWGGVGWGGVGWGGVGWGGVGWGGVGWGGVGVCVGGEGGEGAAVSSSIGQCKVGLFRSLTRMSPFPVGSKAL